MCREIDDESDGDSENLVCNGRSTRGSEERRRFVSADGGQGRFDRTFTALSSLRRRYVLYYLEHTEPATVTDIARHVTAWETDAPPPAVDEESEAVQHVLISLYHDHLPRLDDLQLVEYDRRSGDVRFRDCPETLLEVIELCRPQELPNPTFDEG